MVTIFSLGYSIYLVIFLVFEVFLWKGNLDDGYDYASRSDAYLGIGLIGNAGNLEQIQFCQFYQWANKGFI